MSDEWYYAKGQEQRGPVTLPQLQEMAQSGALAPEQLVWNEAMPAWAYAGGLAQLFNQAELQGAAVATATLPYQSPPQINYYNPAGAVVVYAGFWWRFLAYIIDMAILWVPNFLLRTGVELAVRGALPIPRGNSQAFTISTLAGASLVPMALEWLYFAIMESSSWQGTVGKKVCGIVVTDMNGARLTFGRATGRYFGKILSGLTLYIGFMMAGWTQRKQALHDMLAGTLVIRRNLPRA